MEEQLKSIKFNLEAKEKEAAKLSEENERLSEQLAASMERPRVEGQEQQNGGTAAVENGLEQEWKKKMNVIVLEKETLVKENEQAVAKLQTEVNSYRSQVTKIQADLDTQKAKNDVSIGIFYRHSVVLLYMYWDT